MLLLIASILLMGQLQLVQSAFCLMADSKFGSGCVGGGGGYNSYSYNTRQYTPYRYSYSTTPYQYYGRQPYYAYRQPMYTSWQQPYYYRQPYSGYNYYSYSQPYMGYNPYNYGYARQSAYSYSGLSRDRWGNTYLGSRSNPLWITCRTRYCSG
ncbi:hypothetical protein OESDEN_21481 [Oesophagostomum dentatum]|uniref:Uncharacterized protein n=1 Tax=Oesophagostomum dentatum TaxID=61180 RepID=A0A0B1S6N1_OESDE|nr:hypothetical protein OESDEN_21481 [Oesophagostomum dentatum]